MVVYRTNYSCHANVSHNKYKNIALPGNYRPFKVNILDHSATLSKSIDKSNAFRARPLKHWRKQYGTSNDPRQTNRNHTLINNYMQPGGYIVNDIRKCNNDCNHTVGGTVGIHHNKTSSCDTSGASFDYITCSGEKNCIKYDIPSQARKRTLFSYNNNKPCNPSKSYFSYHQYNYARCGTYKQNITTQCSPYCCKSNSPDNLPDSSCCKCGCDLSHPTYNTPYCKARAIVKPNNPKYHQQGAVSSSSRILRAKLNAVNKNAESIGNKYGDAAQNALNYNGQPEAPYINKWKMNAGGFQINSIWGKYPIDRSLYYRSLSNKKLWHGQQMCTKNCTIRTP